MVERDPVKVKVVGSSPTCGADFLRHKLLIGRFLVRVQAGEPDRTLKV